MRSVITWLSYIVIFVIPLENIFDFGLLGSVSRAMGLLLAGLWIVNVILTGEFRRPRPFHLLVFLFVTWNAMTFFWSLDPDATLDRLLTYYQLLALTFILWDIYTTPAALRRGLQAYVLGAYISIAGTVYNYSIGMQFYTLRYSAAGLSVNDLGHMVALGIPVAWYLAATASASRKQVGLKLLNYAYVPAAILAIILTGSRGSLIATVPALLFGIGTLIQLKPFQKVLILGGLVCCFFGLQIYAPQASLNRLSTIGTTIEEGDMNGRLEIWSEGINLWSEHPLLGIGSAAFRDEVKLGLKNKVAHNSFLSVLTETGIVGFGLFMAILAIVVYEAIHSPKWDAIFWLTVLLVWGLSAFVSTWEQRKPTWLFPSLIVANAHLLRPWYKSTFPVKFSRMPRIAVNPPTLRQ